MQHLQPCNGLVEIPAAACRRKAATAVTALPAVGPQGVATVPHKTTLRYSRLGKHPAMWMPTQVCWRTLLARIGPWTTSPPASCTPWRRTAVRSSAARVPAPREGRTDSRRATRQAVGAGRRYRRRAPTTRPRSAPSCKMSSGTFRPKESAPGPSRSSPSHPHRWGRRRHQPWRPQLLQAASVARRPRPRLPEQLRHRLPAASSEAPQRHRRFTASSSRRRPSPRGCGDPATLLRKGRTRKRRRGTL
mmetsp:Transcript_96534/g.277860  ORF Transcript_96534/g.277860 Transcript_96534/m.277860 type:complete len:247 (-) Transcript_96534:647-1387(-)